MQKGQGSLMLWMGNQRAVERVWGGWAEAAEEENTQETCLE